MQPYRLIDMKLFQFTSLFLLGFTVLLRADPVRVAGNEFQREIDYHGMSLTLRGTHHFRYRRIFSVFTAALYEESEHNRRLLHFIYTRNIRAEDLRKQAMDYLTDTQTDELLEKYAEPLEAIQSAYVDVGDGDAYTLSAVPGHGTRLSLNGEEVFFSDDAEFGTWYMQIWLGDPPLSASLKSALMQGDS